MSNQNTENTENNNTSTSIAFLDAIGRTILCERVESTETQLKVKNPVVLHVVPADNSGKMSVQLLPIFFREFLADKTGDVIFSYEKKNITMTDIDALDFRLQAQYSQMFNKQNTFTAPQQQTAAPSQSVINLFDE
jgi:hypothetical protein